MATLDRLKMVIEAYGGDLERWPESERAELAALATGTPEAASLLAEARALDGVLRSAPVADPDRLARLHEQILAEASAAAGGNAASTGRLTPLPARFVRPTPSPRTPLWAAAALAASLFVGVALGVSDFGRPAVEELAGLAGFETDGGALDALADSDVELL